MNKQENSPDFHDLTFLLRKGQLQHSSQNHVLYNQSWLKWLNSHCYFTLNMSNRGLNPQRLYLWMTQTSEILGVGFVNVHPVLAVADAVEVPGCGEQSIETSRCYLRHLILVLRPLFPNMDLCVGFQLHVYTYRCMYNTQTNIRQCVVGGGFVRLFMLHSHLLCQRYQDRRFIQI